MIHLYYAAAGHDSAQTLMDKLKHLGASVTGHKQKEGGFDKSPGDLCVNWGASTAAHHGGTWLNHSITVNKLSMLKKFEAAGVPTVQFATGKPEASAGYTCEHCHYVKKGNEVWYARMVEHVDGDDLSQKLKHGDFYVKHVDTKHEYRVHVFQGSIIRASLKVPLEPGADPVFKTGEKWGFSNKNYADLLGPCKGAALAAVKALGLDFGGVDVALLHDGSALVFEVNTAPWLGGDASDKYAKAIVSVA